MADPQTGWIIYLNGSYQVIGGTSAVAPMWAAYLALLEVKSFVNPILYSSKSGFHDITLGNNTDYGTNKGYNATPG